MLAIVTFAEPGSTIPYMVQVRFSRTGVSKMRSGGGLTIAVVFSRTRKTGGTGVVGIMVTFVSMSVVTAGKGVEFSSFGRVVVAGSLVIFGTKLATTEGTGDTVVVFRVSARTTLGSIRRLKHTTIRISRTPEDIVRN
jgi:hypothetical protein